jgi:hypothetical protein
MFSIDRKIRVEGQNIVPIMDFGHANNARVGQRHRRVAIFLQQA